MVKIITEEIPFEESLKNKLKFICDFCNTEPKFINGSIRKIERTNLSYIEPHRVIIKGITFLVFNYSKTVYVGNLGKEIKKLNRTIKNKNNQINNYRDEIYDLKEENFKLQNIIDFWQDKFEKLKRFLHDKIFGWFGDKEKYMEFAEELHEEDILDDEDFKELEYEKDDFDLSM